MPHAPIANDEKAGCDVGEGYSRCLEDAAREAELTLLREEVSVGRAFKDDHQGDDGHLKHWKFWVAGDIVHPAPSGFAHFQFAMAGFSRSAVYVGTLGPLWVTLSGLARREMIIPTKLSEAIEAKGSPRCVIGLKDNFIIGVTWPACEINNISITQCLRRVCRVLTHQPSSQRYPT